MVRSAPLPSLPRPQSNGVHFPGNMAFDAAGNGITYASIAAAGGPADQWDALPSAAKLQILVVIGFLEVPPRPPTPPPQSARETRARR